MEKEVHVRAFTKEKAKLIKEKIHMRRVLKLFLPMLFLAGYALSSYFVYYGVDENVFSIKDSLQIVIGNLFLIAILVLYARRICVNWVSKILETKLDLKKAVTILIMIPGILFLIDRITIVVLQHFQGACEPIVRDLGEFKIFIFDALFALLIAPILEELFFRFCLISTYRSLGGKIYGLVMSVLLFGYMHSTMYARVSTVCIAIILGVIFLVTGDLIICILIHAGVNLLITICACVSFYIQDENVISFVSSVVYVNTPILLISIFVSLIGAVYLCKKRSGKLTHPFDAL